MELAYLLELAQKSRKMANGGAGVELYLGPKIFDDKMEIPGNERKLFWLVCYLVSLITYPAVSQKILQ